MDCIYCSQKAVLIEDNMTISKGMAKVKVIANSFKCTVCGRTFKTPEQHTETNQSLHEKKLVLQSQNKDMRKGKTK